ncbi:MAG: diaminopimelate epimerase [Oscillospiraceae bacterium]|nr:diaminopimelate epimerase [Oscillospiraceae bacterium]
MDLKFTKMQGCGNDYIYIDCLRSEIEMPKELIIKLCDRNFGIGGDGVVLILPSQIADAKMSMFNLDGSEGKMCGNAIRCVAKYLHDNKHVQSPHMCIETLSGVKTLEILSPSEAKATQTSPIGSASYVKVDMGKAILNPPDIPVNLSGDANGAVVARPVEIGGRTYHMTCVSMGNPHAVIFCDNVEKFAVSEIGPLFENSELFPDKVNTEFAEVVSRTHLKMRVWERGSGETLACGTGACAAVVAAVLNGYCDKGEDVKVSLKGGELSINYSDNAVTMSGDCMKVFSGVVDEY